jgi:hypothetical protein
MSLYTDVQAGVFAWTNRPEMTAETDIAIRKSVRAAHKAGTFWRDLVTVNLINQPTDQTQSIDLTANAPNFRQMALVKPTGVDLQYNPIGIRELLDQDGYPRADIYYVVGNTLNIRANAPTSSISLTYYRMPVLNPISGLDSWIADLYQDLIICDAAASILAMVGEPEVKDRVEKIAASILEDLIEDNTEAVGR